MSQEEVYNWLKERRDSGDDEYYSITQIATLTKKPRQQIDNNVSKLRYHGFLDSIETLPYYGWIYRLRVKTKS